MSSYFIRLVLEFQFAEDIKWSAHKALAEKLADLVLDSELAKAFTHAGPEYKEKPVKDAAGLRKALAPGKDGDFTALAGNDRNEATANAVFGYQSDSMNLSVRYGGKALASKRATALATLDRIAQGAIALLRDRGGLAKGLIYVADDDKQIVYPRARPPITTGWGTMTQLVQYVDVRFHNDERFDMRQPDLINKVAKAAAPAGVKRTERDGLVTLWWVDSVADDGEVAKALGRFEAWLGKVLPSRPAPGYNELGDLEISPDDRSKKAPFTFFDKDENTAYKAIMVAPDGEVDDDIWSEMAGATKKHKVRLIVPLRRLALKIRKKAKDDGFDAVLYIDDKKRLWNPDPPGDWAVDIRTS
jgi:hypothetical protein